MFDGWATLLRDYGTLSIGDVLAPAIHYAETGCPLVPRVVETIGNVRQFFETEWPTSAAQWLPGGVLPTPGRPFKNPALAKTYGRVSKEAMAKSGREAQIEEARRLWYRGFVAEAIGNFCRTQEVMDTSGRRHRGVLTADDMARWQATVEDPVALDYGRYTAFKCGPWTQGPVLLQQLALLRNFDLDSMEPMGPDFLHTVVECAKLAFADREGFYADPAVVDVPMQGLLSVEYNKERATLVGKQASRELRVGTVGGKPGWVPRSPEQRATMVPEFAAATSGEPTVRRDGATAGDTCHIDVVDKWGNMVSATPSGGWLQSSPTIPEIGFCLGTRMQMFWLDESAPSALRPSVRPRSTLSPSFAYRDGEPYMAFGTPGLPAPRAPQHEPAGGHRGADRDLGALAELVLAPGGAARPPAGRRPHAGLDGRRAAAPRPRDRGRRRLVARPPVRGHARRRRLQGSRQPARHAGLRGRTLVSRPRAPVPPGARARTARRPDPHRAIPPG